MLGSDRAGTTRLIWPSFARSKIVLGLAALAAGCAAPIQDRELWPPPAGAPTHTIIVSVDTWHAMIAFPRTEDFERKAGGVRREGNVQSFSPTSHVSSGSSESSPLASPLPPHASRSLYEEWGYAEEAWYLQGRMGFGGVMRALFSQSPAVVEIAHYDTLWSERTPQPPADQFTFSLSGEGYKRLRRHLEATIADPTPIHSTSHAEFYRAKEPYYWTHNCHHYAAAALQAAGLPINSSLVMTRDTLVSELRRAEGMAPRLNEPAPAGVDAP